MNKNFIALVRNGATVKVEYDGGYVDYPIKQAIEEIIEGARALLEEKQTPDVEGLDLSDFHLTFKEDFQFPFKIMDYAETGLKPTVWTSGWKSWNVRHLKNNNDECLKYPIFGITYDQATSETKSIHLNAMPINKAIAKRIPEGVNNLSLPYVGGMMTTETSFSQRYGYFEFDAKFHNISQGHHLAAWLIASDGSWPPEIDIMEAVNEHNRFFVNHHYNGPDGEKAETNPQEITKIDLKKWNNFGLLWTDQDLVWFFNRKPIHKRKANINKEMHLAFSWEIGGKWPGPVDAVFTEFPADVEIANVRAYQQNPTKGRSTAPKRLTDVVIDEA